MDNFYTPTKVFFSLKIHRIEQRDKLDSVEEGYSNEKDYILYDCVERRFILRRM